MKGVKRKMIKTNYYLCRTQVARKLLLALAVMVASLSVFPQAGYAQTTLQQTGVVLVPPSSIKEGTPLDCIYEYVRQGVPPQQAIDWCDFTDSGQEVPEGGDVGSYLGGLGGSSTGTQLGWVTCLNGGSNPQISADGGTNLQFNAEDYKKYQSWEYAIKPSPGGGYHWSGPLDVPPDSGIASGLFPGKDSNDVNYKPLAQAADEAWKRYQDAMDGYFFEGTGSLDDVIKAGIDAQKAIEKRDGWWPNVSDASNPPGDYPTGNGGTAVVQTDPNAEDPCQQANQFISECSAADWKPEPCKLFLDRLEDPNCDPMTTDPMPGEEACGGDSQPDPEEVERVVTLLCSMEIKPSDPDQDPCAPLEMDAEVLRSDLPSALEQGDPCGNPEALTTEDQCVPSGTDPKVIYMKFRERDMEEALKKLGGPGIIIPMPPQNPPCGDCPQPETGGPTSPDSESGEPGSGPDPDLP